jgi:ribose 5-phosphate isomerase B
MKIAIGSDHGGFELKVVLTKFLRESKMQVKDFGTHSKESCDYPLIGFEVAKAVSQKEFERGVLICKTGIGMTIIANKLSGVRAAACYDIDMARSSREHNDCNVLVLAANYMDEEKAKEIVKVWLKAKHLGERHARRVEQIREFEKDLKRDRKR